MGGPRAAESHSCAGLLPGQRCPPSAGQQPYPALYPTTLLSPEKQPLTARNFRLTPRGGGRRGGERKRPGNLVDRELGKEWQNPDRLQHCDGKKHFSWVGEKGRGEFSRMLKLLWDFSAQRLRAGKTTLPFLKLSEIALNVHCGVFQLWSASNLSVVDKEITFWFPLEKLHNSCVLVRLHRLCPTVISCLLCLRRPLFPSLSLFKRSCFLLLYMHVKSVRECREETFWMRIWCIPDCERWVCTLSRHMKAEVWSCALHFSFQSAQRLSHKVHARTEKSKKKPSSTAAVLSRCVTQMRVVSGVFTREYSSWCWLNQAVLIRSALKLLHGTLRAGLGVEFSLSRSSTLSFSLLPPSWLCCLSKEAHPLYPPPPKKIILNAVWMGPFNPDWFCWTSLILIL